MFLVFNGPLRDNLKSMTSEENLDIHTVASFLLQTGIRDDDISKGFDSMMTVFYDREQAIHSSRWSPTNFIFGF